MKNRFWRTLIRVKYIEGDTVAVIIPGWDSTIIIPFQMSIFPMEWKNLLQPGLRFFAQATIGVDYMQDMKIKDFEVPEDDVPSGDFWMTPDKYIGL